jgi:ectoine hydroxylase-related dioxygenase (phytanoyl-CoA dioxygenase family)
MLRGRNKSMTACISAPLTRGQVLEYYRDGYLGPIMVVPPEDMEQIRRRIDLEVFSSAGPNPNQHGSRIHCRHLDHPFLMDLLRAPVLIDIARSLLGDDVMVWSSNFWVKPPGGTAVPWHQDIDYWPLNPQLNITLWLAIDPTSRENGCLQVIPTSHRSRYEHRQVAGQMLDREAQFASDGLPAPVPLEMQPGECVLFNERILHHSAPNVSSQRRTGLGIRLTAPFVHVDQDGPVLYPAHRCVMLTGKDRFGLNRLLEA